MMRDRRHLRESLENKAQELFSLCDPHGKGYATKADLEMLRCELPLPPDQLDVVFDALDTNADGKLTLQEFTDGFGIFLGIDTLPNSLSESEQLIETEDEEILEELLDHLGARNLFTDEDYLREMWRRVRKEDPVMRSNFENFISKMAADLKDSMRERSNLQTTLNNRKQEHEAQVQTLYMEMEEQLRLEKEKILQREQRKEQRMRDELETELQLKDQQLSELLEKHAQMESQLEAINSVDSRKNSENVKLQRDKDMLENRLAASDKLLHSMKSSLELLRKRSVEEKRKRAQAALKVSEGIALERENLVKELCHLKQVNKQLQDEKDELVQSTASRIPVMMNSVPVCQKKKQKESENADIKEHVRNHSLSSNVSLEKGSDESHNNILRNKRRSFTQSHPLQQEYNHSNAENKSSNVENTIGASKSLGIKAYVEDFDSDGDIQNNLNIPPDRKVDQKYDKRTNATRSSNTSSTYTSVKTSPPVIKKISSIKPASEEILPTRVFKVVFVGDSGVGKTSILQRFCTESFKTTYSATVGVDFQIKTIELDGERIALQLWDTAGQERFRSMTQQYFRKSDGIIVVYDVTCESSFKNVRNWMSSIKEETPEDTLVLLLGNKIDLCEKEKDRVVKTKDGAWLSDDYGTLFYETSAKSGASVSEAFEGLATILKTKEDEAMEHVLKLQLEEEKKKKKKCC